MDMLTPGAATTFPDYVKQVFLPYILSQMHHVSRLDVVWDEYLPESMKAETHSKSGKFVDVLKHRAPFLEIGRSFWDSMRIKLSCYLASNVKVLDTDKQIISTHKTREKNWWNLPKTRMVNLTHKEGCVPSSALLGTDDGYSAELSSPGHWGGNGKTQADGNFTGPHFQMRQRPVVNSSAVGAKSDENDSANVSRQHSSVLPFANVMDYVLWANIALHWQHVILYVDGFNII